MHDESSFITLTYSPEHLPENGTLSVDDTQRFLKRLRKSLWPKKIRFFLCGEYGEKLGRPHYHAIVFGHAFPDKVPLSSMSYGGGVRSEFQLYDSAALRAVWGKGDVRVGTVTFESAAYVANYATKKITGPSAAAHYQGRKPEFLLMSRKPGIARAWYEKYSSDVYPSDEVIVRGKETRPPRYYDQILEKDNPVLLESIKAKREAQAEKLEAYTLHDGHVVHVAPGRNARRLAVREKVAKAKASLKSRTYEENK